MKNLGKNENQVFIAPKLPFISQKQLEKELSCSRYFIHTLVVNKQLTKYKLNGKVYYKLEELNTLFLPENLSTT